MNPLHWGDYELKTKFPLCDKMLQKLIAAVQLNLLWMFVIPEDESFSVFGVQVLLSVEAGVQVFTGGFWAIDWFMSQCKYTLVK